MKFLTTIVFILLISNCMSQTNDLSKEDYFKTAQFIWDNYVPASGQSDHVQGELLRAIEKLRDEAHRNGNINFHEKCHGLLIAFLRTTLSDSNLFDRDTITQIHSDLDRLSIANQPYTFDTIFDRITSRIVDYYVFYSELIPHKKNSELQC